MTGSSLAHHAHEDQTGREYFHHSSGQRINTNTVLVEALRKQYPNLDLIVAPRGPLNLLAYASAGLAKATPIQDSINDPVYSAALTIRSYVPPPRRLDDRPGFMVEDILFGKYMYKWKGHEFLLYIANGRDGSSSYPDITNHYILTKEAHYVDELMKEATLWGIELHDEVWVFDQGYWQKSRELWESVQKSRWEDVILEEGMKKAIIADVVNFFDGQETYGRLKVPWKRGIIYYGPPGNGKTISIKAMMHALSQRGLSDSKMTVPTLYVRTLSSFAGPEYSLRAIFQKARETAPCYLVFEDLDSIVNDSVRSYFLNEVDGLKSNDGILMVGSTNHLDRLDPGISKRPSRFDRKYYFSDPDFEQRVAYTKYWQGKLKSNKDLDFPDALCPAVAKITDKFSFAYMQEAFVASLLAIAVRGDGEPSDAWRYAGPQDPISFPGYQPAEHSGHPVMEDLDQDLSDLVLWKEIQIQVKILKEEMEEKSGDRAEGPELSVCPCPRGETPMNSSGSQPKGLYNQQSKQEFSKTQLGHKSAEQPREDTAAKSSLFTSFEQWKMERMSIMPQSPASSSNDNHQPNRMVENPVEMTPKYRTRNVLENSDRIQSEFFKNLTIRSQAPAPALTLTPKRMTELVAPKLASEPLSQQKQGNPSGASVTIENSSPLWSTMLATEKSANLSPLRQDGSTSYLNSSGTYLGESTPTQPKSHDTSHGFQFLPGRPWTKPVNSSLGTPASSGVCVHPRQDLPPFTGNIARAQTAVDALSKQSKSPYDVYICAEPAER